MPRRKILLEESFIVRSYKLEFISVAHPNTTLAPTIDLYDNAQGDTRSRHAVIYFHVTPDTFGIPGFQNNVFYLHYDISLLQPTMDMLNAKQQVVCYFKSAKSESWAGLRSELITR